MSKSPMLVVIRRPTSKREWGVAIGLVSAIAWAIYRIGNPVVQSVFLTETRVDAMADRLVHMDSRLTRVESILMRAEKSDRIASDGLGQ